MIIVNISSTSPDVEFRLHPVTKPDTGGTGGTGGGTGGSGTWSLIPRPTNMELFEVGGNSLNPFPFANSTAWNPIKNVVRCVCGDHGNTPRHLEWNPQTNVCTQVDNGSMGSHLYQNYVVNPYTGEEFLFVPGGADSTKPDYIASGIYKYNEATKMWEMFAHPNGWTPTLNVSWTNTITGCLSWWEGNVVGGGAQGALVRFDSNVGNIELLDPLTKKWTIITGMSPGRVGMAHAVSAFSKKYQLLAYGGGNGGDTINPRHPWKTINIIDGNGNPATAQVPYNQLLWAMDATGKRITIPLAPDHVGIYHGHNLVACPPTGNVHLIGYGKHWAYDLSNVGNITLNRLPDPPATLLTPIGQGKPSGFMSCAFPGGIYAFNSDRSRTPHSQIQMFTP